MSTHVDAPAPRNIGQEATDTLQTQINLAPQELASYQQTAPEYAATDISILGRSLFGDGFEGNLSDINRRLTDEAAAQSRTANTAQRAADIADVQAMGPDVLAAQRAANPELFGNLSALDRSASGDISAGTYESLFGNAAGRASATFNPSGVSNSMTTPDGPNAIETALQQQALSELGLGDQLSADEQRQVRVQSRSAADARGRGFSNAALADEVLNSANARQSRLAGRRDFASGVNTQLRSGQAADRGYALARDQFRTGVDQFNAGMGLSAAQFNAGRTDADRAALATAAGMETGRRQEGFGRQLSATQARLATYSDPFAGVLGRSSSNVGNNGQLFGNTGAVQGGMQQSRTMFDPFNPYAQDLYNTNYNAQAAAGISSANNNASMYGAGIGGGAMIGAALIM